ncbi:unnamed protein product [Notodromas monacha]|uniref:N-myc downstream regulated n=1 Tax=Notodromas monacha TaxID=399045 RepID=A0A7R9GFS1_9CRUS|nr:unnamed protein product [Notodromas monacha]CAG0919447.1 unnamed protein product [Notodromas monacha]
MGNNKVGKWVARSTPGEIQNAEKRAVFLTIHDIGCNHTSFHDFVEHPAMNEIKARSIFIHIDVPGQEDNSPDLPDGFVFPTLQVLAEDLVTVLDFLHLKYAVLIGEGAGANVATRFAMAYPARTLGVILIHPTSTVAGIMENVKDKIRMKFFGIGSVRNQTPNVFDGNPDRTYKDFPTRSQLCYFLKFDTEFVFPTLQVLAEDLVTVLDFLHLKYAVLIGEGAGANVATRFAMAYPARTLGVILIHPTSTVAGIMENVKDKQVEQAENKARVIEEFQQKLRSSINTKNLRRTDVSHSLKEKLEADALLITGAKSSYKHSVSTMLSNMNPAKSQMIQIEGVGDALNEAPEKVSQSLLLFAKGLGLLSSVTMVGVERQRTFSSGSNASDDGNPACIPRRNRSMSMEEYDRPNLKRLTSREGPPRIDRTTTRLDVIIIIVHQLHHRHPSDMELKSTQAVARTAVAL